MKESRKKAFSVIFLLYLCLLSLPFLYAQQEGPADARFKQAVMMRPSPPLPMP
ncbi:MAG: hypothetical protein K8I29_13220 [Alphaproteobacteria bacterium]|uniref:Uncharacterized protein n=1 Tax=Candidatus Nitrobium versatile TaxID=2884831 RepID=A0A953M2A0_9BACT|nr:hypothetical protein [Candidatus Nitrobium versatile]